VAGGLIWIPVRNGILAFDRDGATPLDVLRSASPGNLLLQDGLFVSASRDNVEVYSDPAGLLAAADAKTKENPTIPSRG
jgi:hypothetical protein